MNSPDRPQMFERDLHLSVQTEHAAEAAEVQGRINWDEAAQRSRERSVELRKFKRIWGPIAFLKAEKENNWARRKSAFNPEGALAEYAADSQQQITKDAQSIFDQGLMEQAAADILNSDIISREEMLARQELMARQDKHLGLEQAKLDQYRSSLSDAIAGYGEGHLGRDEFLAHINDIIDTVKADNPQAFADNALVVNDFLEAAEEYRQYFEQYKDQIDPGESLLKIGEVKVLGEQAKPINNLKNKLANKAKDIGTTPLFITIGTSIVKTANFVPGLGAALGVAGSGLRRELRNKQHIKQVEQEQVHGFYAKNNISDKSREKILEKLGSKQSAEEMLDQNDELLAYFDGQDLNAYDAQNDPERHDQQLITNLSKLKAMQRGQSLDQDYQPFQYTLGAKQRQSLRLIESQARLQQIVDQLGLQTNVEEAYSQELASINMERAQEYDRLVSFKSASDRKAAIITSFVTLGSIGLIQYAPDNWSDLAVDKIEGAIDNISVAQLAAHLKISPAELLGRLKGAGSASQIVSHLNPWQVQSAAAAPLSSLPGSTTEVSPQYNGVPGYSDLNTPTENPLPVTIMDGQGYRLPDDMVGFTNEATHPVESVNAPYLTNPFEDPNLPASSEGGLLGQSLEITTHNGSLDTALIDNSNEQLLQIESSPGQLVIDTSHMTDLPEGQASVVINLNPYNSAEAQLVKIPIETTNGIVTVDSSQLPEGVDLFQTDPQTGQACLNPDYRIAVAVEQPDQSLTYISSISTQDVELSSPTDSSNIIQGQQTMSDGTEGAGGYTESESPPIVPSEGSDVVDTDDEGLAVQDSQEDETIGPPPNANQKLAPITETEPTATPAVTESADQADQATPGATATQEAGTPTAYNPDEAVGAQSTTEPTTTPPSTAEAESTAAATATQTVESTATSTQEPTSTQEATSTATAEATSTEPAATATPTATAEASPIISAADIPDGTTPTAEASPVVTDDGITITAPEIPSSPPPSRPESGLDLQPPVVSTVTLESNLRPATSKPEAEKLEFGGVDQEATRGFIGPILPPEAPPQPAVWPPTERIGPANELLSDAAADQIAEYFYQLSDDELDLKANQYAIALAPTASAAQVARFRDNIRSKAEILREQEMRSIVQNNLSNADNQDEGQQLLADFVNNEFLSDKLEYPTADTVLKHPGFNHLPYPNRYNDTLLTGLIPQSISVDPEQPWPPANPLIATGTDLYGAIELGRLLVETPVLEIKDKARAYAKRFYPGMSEEDMGVFIRNTQRSARQFAADRPNKTPFAERKNLVHLPIDTILGKARQIGENLAHYSDQDIETMAERYALEAYPTLTRTEFDSFPARVVNWARRARKSEEDNVEDTTAPAPLTAEERTILFGDKVNSSDTPNSQTGQSQASSTNESNTSTTQSSFSPYSSPGTPAGPPSLAIRNRVVNWSPEAVESPVVSSDQLSQPEPAELSQSEQALMRHLGYLYDHIDDFAASDIDLAQDRRQQLSAAALQRWPQLANSSGLLKLFVDAVEGKMDRSAQKSPASSTESQQSPSDSSSSKNIYRYKLGNQETIIDLNEISRTTKGMTEEQISDYLFQRYGQMANPWHLAAFLNETMRLQQEADSQDQEANSPQDNSSITQPQSSSAAPVNQRDQEAAQAEPASEQMSSVSDKQQSAQSATPQYKYPIGPRLTEADVRTVLVHPDHIDAQGNTDMDSFEASIPDDIDSVWPPKDPIYKGRASVAAIKLGELFQGRDATEISQKAGQYADRFYPTMNMQQRGSFIEEAVVQAEGFARMNAQRQTQASESNQSAQAKSETINQEGRVASNLDRRVLMDYIPWMKTTDTLRYLTDAQIADIAQKRWPQLNIPGALQVAADVRQYNAGSEEPDDLWPELRVAQVEQSQPVKPPTIAYNSGSSPVQNQVARASLLNTLRQRPITPLTEADLSGSNAQPAQTPSRPVEWPEQTESPTFYRRPESQTPTKPAQSTNRTNINVIGPDRPSAAESLPTKQEVDKVVLGEDPEKFINSYAHKDNLSPKDMSNIRSYGYRKTRQNLNMANAQDPRWPQFKGILQADYKKLFDQWPTMEDSRRRRRLRQLINGANARRMVGELGLGSSAGPTAGPNPDQPATQPTETESAPAAILPPLEQDAQVAPPAESVPPIAEQSPQPELDQRPQQEQADSESLDWPDWTEAQRQAFDAQIDSETEQDIEDFVKMTTNTKPEYIKELFRANHTQWSEDQLDYAVELILRQQNRDATGRPIRQS